MRLVAWNVAHAARECPLRPGLLDAIASLEPDVLMLNEYVHDASRAAFVAVIAELGLRHVLFMDIIQTCNLFLRQSSRRLRATHDARNAMPRISPANAGSPVARLATRDFHVLTRLC